MDAQPIVDGFDYPLGKPFVTETRDSDPYYNARDFRVSRHLGEDWNGNGGGDTDLGDPVFAIAHGQIVSAQNEGPGWGNVVIIEHLLPSGVRVRSLYGHLDAIMRTSGEVHKGEPIGTIGRGYDYGAGVHDYSNAAHLHLEIRVDASKGLGAGYASDASGWTDPSKFIDVNRTIQSPPTSGSIIYRLRGEYIDYSGRRQTINVQYTSTRSFITSNITVGANDLDFCTTTSNEESCESAHFAANFPGFPIGTPASALLVTLRRSQNVFVSANFVFSAGALSNIGTHSSSQGQLTVLSAVYPVVVEQ